MTKQPYEIVKTFLAQVEVLEQARHQLYALDSLCRPQNRLPEEPEHRAYTEAYGHFHDRLWKLELDAWHSVAMFALTLTADQQTEVRALAYRRWLSDHQSVRWILEPMGQPTTGWHGDDEQELRVWLHEHFVADKEKRGDLAP